MFYRDNDESDGIAYSDPDDELLFLPETGPVEDWPQMRLTLKDGGLTDYLGNDLGCRLLSARFRQLVGRLKSSADVLQWLPVAVITGNEECQYFVLHFPEPADVLDEAASIWMDEGWVIKPVFSYNKMIPHEVFTYRTGGQSCNSRV